MTNYNKGWNEKSLKAWNEWKVICSICGCPAKYQQILLTEVTNAFQKKFHSVIGSQLDHLFTSYYPSEEPEESQEERDDLPSQSGRLPEDREYYNTDDTDDIDAPPAPPEPEEDVGEGDLDEQEDDDLDGEAQDRPISRHDARVNWGHEFDCGIIEKAHVSKSPINYKDHTWESIANSSDPPLKIIRGQLLGYRGIINEIAERFLRNNYPEIWEKLISLQDPVPRAKGDEGTLTLEDKIPAPKSPIDNPLDKSDRDYIEQYFKNLFTNDNAAIFLVKLTDNIAPCFTSKISLAIPELSNYVGLSSTTVYDRYVNVIRPKLLSLPTECLEAMRAPGVCNLLVSLLINQLKPEKRAIPLLQRIEKAMQ